MDKATCTKLLPQESRNPSDRREGNIVPIPLASSSSDGLPKVSPVSILVGLATADDVVPLPGSIPWLRPLGRMPGNYIPEFPSGPRPLRDGEIITCREQFRDGIVRDTIETIDGIIVERFLFKGWLANLGAPGVRPFFYRRGPSGDLVRCSFSREKRERIAREKAEYREYRAELSGEEDFSLSSESLSSDKSSESTSDSG